MSWRDIVKLTDKQKKLDRNYNNRIDEQDFHIMREETKKRVDMDESVRCCEEARLKIVQWFDATKENTTSSVIITPNIRIILTNISHIASEKDCDTLYDKINEFVVMLKEEKTIFDSIDGQALEDIMTDWDKCNKKPIAQSQSKTELEERLDSLRYLADMEQDWYSKHLKRN